LFSVDLKAIFLLALSAFVLMTNRGLIFLIIVCLTIFCHGSEVLVVDGPRVVLSFAQNGTTCFLNNTLPATEVVFVHLLLLDGPCALTINITDPAQSKTPLSLRLRNYIKYEICSNAYTS
jgi:hypothetical protein